ncbi:MAG: RNA-binding protein [Chitinophagaceae bacterium]|nr:MAG: RNA-binding protein [Chitinophagaceae bacterium]
MIKPFQTVLLLCCFHAVVSQQPLFSKLSAAKTGINFTNTVREDDSLHIMRYEYLYNGHGVGIGDFDQDGLPDVFISGNSVPCKLYMNKGGLRFEDVTSRAGITNSRKWATGVSVADVNGDGLTDVYVSHSGFFKDPIKLSNELWINQGLKDGVPLFKEMAADYGLDAPGTQSTQALFLDYDLDGDLDMFLLNHSNHTYNPFLNTRKIRSEPHMQFGNRLFRNDRTETQVRFTDVTLQAGIVNNALNFGLSVNASDINGDGYPDIYSTSDYTEKDCLYLNNGDGTFTESIEKSVAYMSKYSMGSDIADYNNDGRFDIMTLDMLPPDNYRQKLLKGPDEYDQYHLLADSGYYHQQMRNMLQLNQGKDAAGNLHFSEIGQLAGVSNTDWSWAALFADFDNDGWKDLFVSNGYLRDFTNLDFLRYTVSDAQLEEAKKGNFNFRTFDLVKKMPSNKLRNYIFRNRGDLTFEDKSKAWGLDDLAVSNGAAYADFDNDGDLDLIVCRNNDPVAVYENTSGALFKRNHVKVSLKGKGFNTAALGAKAYVYAGGMQQVQEVYPVRGYQSSVATSLHFGLGDAGRADSIVIIWPDRSVTRKINPAINSVVAFDQNGEVLLQPSVAPTSSPALTFRDITKTAGLDFVHKENPFVDFKNEVLLPYQLSRSGPAMCAADVNGDGLPDVFFGGAIDQPSALYLQQADGKFVRSISQPWSAEAAFEDVNALFFDADGDGDNDLYVVSGGNEYDNGSPEYADRLYINNGKGSFARVNVLPAMLSSKKAVAVGDFDGDKDLDIFIGGQSVPGAFPMPARSYILRNDSKNGQVVFTDVTAEVAPELLNAGIVHDAVWSDLNADGYPELMLAVEWSPVELYSNKSGKLQRATTSAGLHETSGLWCSLTAADIDGDGDTDFIAGNAGLNTQFKASSLEPLEMYAADFDGNGIIDPLISYYIDGKPYPIASRDELLEQMPGLKKKFLYYKDYAASNLGGILTKSQLGKATKYKVNELASVVLRNEGNMKFRVEALPIAAQFSMLSGVITGDLNNDGRNDLLLAGNFYPYRVQLGRSAGSLGALLLGQENGEYKVVDNNESNFYANGDTRKMLRVPTASGHILILGKNNEPVQVYKLP